jgi:PAS domain S-box-containing protein
MPDSAAPTPLSLLSLDALQAQLAAIVASSDDAIVSKNLDGSIQSWNAGAERIFGWKADEVIGKPITIIIPPDRLHEEPKILARLRSGDRVDHFETIRMTKDGRLIPISVTISPVRDSTGKIIGASKIARDVTLVKEYERRMTNFSLIPLSSPLYRKIHARRSDIPRAHYRSC